jgi:hypothetical protein
MLQKIRADKARVLVFLPLWPLSLWWDNLKAMQASPLLSIPLYKQPYPVTQRMGADPRCWTGKTAVAVILQG